MRIIDARKTAPAGATTAKEEGAMDDVRKKALPNMLAMAGMLARFMADHPDVMEHFGEYVAEQAGGMLTAGDAKRDVINSRPLWIDLAITLESEAMIQEVERISEDNNPS